MSNEKETPMTTHTESEVQKAKELSSTKEGIIEILDNYNVNDPQILSILKEKKEILLEIQKESV